MPQISKVKPGVLYRNILMFILCSIYSYLEAMEWTSNYPDKQLHSRNMPLSDSTVEPGFPVKTFYYIVPLIVHTF